MCRIVICMKSGKEINVITNENDTTDNLITKLLYSPIHPVETPTGEIVLIKTENIEFIKRIIL